MEELKKLMAEKEAKKIIEKDIVEINDILNKKFKIIDLSNNDDWDRFRDHYYRRHLIIHTNNVIDEKYLIKYLTKGKFNSVGLDVFENEPNVNPELIKFPNVLILPHMGSATKEARSGMAELAVSNVINVLKNKPPLTPVT